MTLFVISILFSCVLLAIAGKHDCDKLGTLFYEEIGCEPVYEGAQGCPSSYKCAPYELSTESCKFQGGIYKAGEYLDSAKTISSCNAGCICTRQGVSEKKTIRCAILDCPENMMARPKNGCHYKYEIGKCCANTKQLICPSYEGNAVCKANGKDFYEGQKFEPSGTCMRCVCRKGFKGALEEPHCRKMSCGFEIRHADALENKCAPVYFVQEGGALCCPSNFICPMKEDVIKKRSTPAQHGGTCMYGDKIIKADEEFERILDQWGKKRNVKCVCDLPPLVTCTADY